MSPEPAVSNLRLCARDSCETELTGRQRAWCSENCRKRACDDRHRAICVDCGMAMGTRSGWANKGASERCRPCHVKREAAARLARLDDVAVMYRSGMPTAAIARELGYGLGSYPPEITECFHRGLLTDADHRYDEMRRQNIARGRWGVAA